MSSSSQYAPRSFNSPLDQIVNGMQPQQTRHAILERAVTLTRKTSGRRRPQVENGAHMSQDAQNGVYNPAREPTGAGQSSAGGSNDTSTRQRVQDLRAARLSQMSASSDASTSSSVDSDITSLDQSIAGPSRYYPHSAEDSFADHPDRIAEAIRGLTLRRRQSIDTVRSSEFGEGGRWDRAWGGSDDEDEEDNESVSMLDDVDIEGNTPNAFSTRIISGRRGNTSPVPHFASMNGAHMPFLHDAGNQHTVSLTSSRVEKRLNSSGHSPSTSYAGPDNLQRRSTIMSMMGDMGRVSPSPSQDHHTVSNAPIGRNEWNASTQSLASDNSQTNSHVCVWPPTPQGSEQGGHHQDDNQVVAGDQMLYARPDQVGRSQEAKVEVYEAPAYHHNPTKTLPQQRQYPVSPSAALAQPLRDPLREPDIAYAPPRLAGRDQSANTNRVPLHPSNRSNTSHENVQGYSDPNKPLPGLQYDGLGEARRRAIEAHDGRESLVSDLDVETLRLDGSNGSEGSRRDSTSTIGSFSSEKIREQRQRRSDATIMTSSDKRSSSDTIKNVPRITSKDMQHRSWNGANGQLEARPAVPPPKRSNTGPDDYINSSSSNHTNMLGGPQVERPAVKFNTPKSNGDIKKSGVIVKGAIQQTEAERFLTLAITHHETGDLSRSAYYFERSAKIEGGCVVGMCMWGMALREGWGVRKDQKKGFDWISKAATRAGEMMAGSQGATKSETEIKAIRSELKLSVYELGKCFCYGWGVKMDKQMALEYFELAARLGDADAQAEAGALLAAGKGCKKDLKKAAAYYRMAETQGYDTVGLSWIHKTKYD